MRMDILEDGCVAIHTCAVSDTTAYVRYPGGDIIANVVCLICFFDLLK
jgi:hypothetical protein